MANESFEKNVDRALADAQLRKNFAFAMGNFILKRRAVFSDAEQTERLRALGQAIKQRALSRLPELLEQLEAACTRNGIRVHWAETTAVANRIVLEIIESHAASRVVKGKSMVSEEMHLNAFLATHGIEAVETDLGEFIIQLNGETPSHIIVPAIHKNKAQIAKIFHEKVAGAPYTEEVTELNAIARNTLRRKFYEAGIGLSGVNFAVAETGTLCLVENEGNGRNVHRRYGGAHCGDGAGKGGGAAGRPAAPAAAADGIGHRPARDHLCQSDYLSAPRGGKGRSAGSAPGDSG